MLDVPRASLGASELATVAFDTSAGKLIDTGNPLDLAVSGDGYFVVRAPGQGMFYTRQGQFRRDDQGRLVTGAGLVLQADGGGDLMVGQGALVVAADATVTVDAEPVGRIALAVLNDPAAVIWGAGSVFSAPDAAMSAAARPQVKQGTLESSNVSTGDEMVAMMAALRRAETGQRLMLVYDDLMGRVLTTFGQA